MQKSISTPWGPSQTATELAPGIVAVTTASHGGIILDADHPGRGPGEAEDGGMSGYIVEIRKRGREAARYWPRSFGFQTHKWAETPTEAEVFETEELAYRYLNGFRYPNYFWNSEWQHAQRMKAWCDRHTCRVVPSEAEPTRKERAAA